MKPVHKTAKTIKDYAVKYKGWDVTVPGGSTVSNETGMGFDDNYRFWTDWRKSAEHLTGFKNSMLAHDLTYYGINVPADHCQAYP